MARSSELSAWRRLALKSGWTIKAHGHGGHEKWYPPGSGLFVTVAHYGGSWRNIKNVRATLRRAGLDI